MKKIVMMVAIMMVAMNVFAGEMTNMKIAYEGWLASTNDTTVAIENSIGQANAIAVYVNNNWDADSCIPVLVADNAIGITATMGSKLLINCSEDNLPVAGTLVAERVGKYLAIAGLTMRSNSIGYIPRDWSAIFALPNPETSSLKADTLMRAKISAREGRLVHQNTMTLSETVEVLAITPDVRPTVAVDVLKAKVLVLSEPYAKATIRARGDSFVTKDGINPVDTEIQPIVDALNAPKLAGLVDALTAIGVTLSPDTLTDKNWVGIEVYFSDVDTGAVELNDFFVGSIVLLLGVDGFNEWKDSYNGE